MSKFPLEFNECPNCGGSERVVELAMQEVEKGKGVKRENPFVSMEKVGIPLTNPLKIVGVTVPILLCHFDICASCGLRRCVKAEIIDAPMKFAAPQQGPPGMDMRGGGLRPA